MPALTLTLVQVLIREAKSACANPNPGTSAYYGKLRVPALTLTLVQVLIREAESACANPNPGTSAYTGS